MKRRTGFVSNSSSSSFVLFGTSIDENKINEMYGRKLTSDMLSKWGTAEQVPPATETSHSYITSEEELFHTFNKEGADIFEDTCSYEKAEFCNVSYVDEYIGYVAGFCPTWFKENPTKTWEDAVQIHTNELIDLGLTVEEISFDYIEEVQSC